MEKANGVHPPNLFIIDELDWQNPNLSPEVVQKLVNSIRPSLKGMSVGSPIIAVAKGVDSKFRQLTRNQIYELTKGKKHWSKKKDHLISLAKFFGIFIGNDAELQYLIETHCPDESKRMQREYFAKSQKGILKTKFTPTDLKDGFKPVETPRVGQRYHISWAFSGAVFVLKRIEGDTCYLDNPKHKREKRGLKLLTCKTSDLRGLASRNKF